ncbi:cytochrome P450, putative [Ixodes scapularis]|uniref:Cytochrome P450, putative n=1 Tax=Ixodes scapularis TaxID=6945 RepID=B7QA85_IXOSC|nr:cytochrome P450, putative [Ixodes scapularis]|eukprot:XP_002400111.1 cytochrome P450, putative [Ixodes scapularis]
MLAAREEALQQEKSDAQYLTEANMVQILIDIFGGATESSIGTMRWLCLTLAQRTDIQTKIQQEIEDNIGSSPPTLKDRERLPYTVACIYETLRVYPVGPLGFPHNTCCDTQAGGKFIPKDTGVLYNIHAVNHDPALWKDPEVFRPERFLDPVTGKLNLEGQPQLLSFGLGPRTCPGEKLGQMDMFYVLVRLLQRVSFGVPDGASCTDIKQLASSVFLMPAVQETVLTRMY